MLERIAEPTLPARSRLLMPRLVVRESCGAYLPHKATRPKRNSGVEATAFETLCDGCGA